MKTMSYSVFCEILNVTIILFYEWMYAKQIPRNPSSSKYLHERNQGLTLKEALEIARLRGYVDQKYKDAIYYYFSDFDSKNKL